MSTITKNKKAIFIDPGHQAWVPTIKKLAWRGSTKQYLVDL